MYWPTFRSVSSEHRQGPRRPLGFSWIFPHSVIPPALSKAEGTGARLWCPACLLPGRPAFSSAPSAARRPRSAPFASRVVHRDGGTAASSNVLPHSMRLTPRQPAAPQRKKKSAVSRTTQPAPEARHNLAQPVRAGNHFPIRPSAVGATRSLLTSPTNRHLPPTSTQINAVILRASDEVRHVDSGDIYRRCPKNLNVNTFHTFFHDAALQRFV